MVKLFRSCLRLSLAAALGLGLAGCSEPDRQVTRSTADNAFALSLRAEENWVFPGDSRPVQVTVERLAGPPAEDLVDVVEFVSNNGSISPSSLPVYFAGADTLGQGGDVLYIDWVTFKASSSVSSRRQGEIRAIFRDALATLKIRIAVSPESLL